MSEWKEYKVGELLILEYGKSLNEYRSGIGKFEVFGTNGIIGLTDKFLYDEPALIIGRKGAYREVHFAKKPFFVIDTAFYTKKKNNLTNTSFIYYWFKNVDINAMDSGSAIPSTSRDEVYDIDIVLPPLPEQTAIAEILSSLDDKIDLLHRQNKTLEQIAETLFRQWFIEEAEEGWEEGTLNDVITMKGGSTPSTNEPKYWDGNIYWTTPRDLSNTTSVYLFDTSRKITEEGLNQISSRLLPIGTLLLSSRAPIGYLAITEIPLAINQGYIAIICDKNISTFFMYLWCKINMETIENAGNGSVFQEISKSAFRTLEIKIPPNEKLNHFDIEIKPIFQKIKINSQQIRILTHLRDALLPKLMNGEIRVN